MFKKAPIPPMKVGEASNKRINKNNTTIMLLVLLIFLGGAAECTMSQWVSGYAETIIEIPKIWGDIFGYALFLALLGLGRTLYSKLGKNILRVLFFGMLGALICYITASISTIPLVGLFACAFAGLCTSMLWPGSLILLDKKIKNPSVGIYALMAAGGDLGASLSPQLLGIVSDIFGMRTGIMVASLFPLVGIILVLYFILSEKGTFSQMEKSK